MKLWLSVEYFDIKQLTRLSLSCRGNTVENTRCKNNFMMARLGICLNRLLLESLSTLTMYTLNLENAGMVLYCESFDRIQIV